MRALGLHAGNPRALQNRSCSLPADWLDRAWSDLLVSWVLFVWFTVWLLQVPITGSLSWATESFTVNVLTYHCRLQPVERPPHLEREKA